MCYSSLVLAEASSGARVDVEFVAGVELSWQVLGLDRVFLIWCYGV